MVYVYVLVNEEGRIYIGSTRDLKKRMAQHQAGEVRTTKVHGKKWTLTYYEAYRAERDARTREERLKNHGQAKRQLKERISVSLQLS